MGLKVSGKGGGSAWIQIGGFGFMVLVHGVHSTGHCIMPPQGTSYVVPFPKGPCTQIVYTLVLKYSLYRYIGPKVYTIWVHGPLGFRP